MMRLLPALVCFCLALGAVARDDTLAEDLKCAVSGITGEGKDAGKSVLSLRKLQPDGGLVTWHDLGPKSMRQRLCRGPGNGVQMSQRNVHDEAQPADHPVRFSFAPIIGKRSLGKITLQDPDFRKIH